MPQIHDCSHFSLSFVILVIALRSHGSPPYLLPQYLHLHHLAKVSKTPIHNFARPAAFLYPEVGSLAFIPGKDGHRYNSGHVGTPYLPVSPIASVSGQVRSEGSIVAWVVWYDLPCHDLLLDSFPCLVVEANVSNVVACRRVMTIHHEYLLRNTRGVVKPLKHLNDEDKAIDLRRSDMSTYWPGVIERPEPLDLKLESVDAREDVSEPGHEVAKVTEVDVYVHVALAQAQTDWYLQMNPRPSRLPEWQKGHACGW